MTRTDEELAQAIRDSEASAQDPAAPVASQSQEPEPVQRGVSPQRNVGLLVTLLVIIAGILSLVMTTFDDAAIYSMGVDQLAPQKAQLSDRNLRVEGKLVSGSLVRRTSPCEYRFRIEKNGAELEVHYPQCIVPDTFRDVKGVDVHVTAEGRLASGGFLLASQIFAKCPSKYEMKQAAETAGMPPGQGMDSMLIPAKVVDD